MAKILLVDDAAFMRKVIKDTLSKSGYTELFEAVDGAGNDGFHYGNGRGEGGKGNGNEEYDGHRITHRAHGGKDLGKGHEHQAGAAGHTVSTHEGKDRGDDHKAGKESNQSVK